MPNDKTITTISKTLYMDDLGRIRPIPKTETTPRICKDCNWCYAMLGKLVCKWCHYRGWNPNEQN